MLSLLEPPAGFLLGVEPAVDRLGDPLYPGHNVPVAGRDVAALAHDLGALTVPVLTLGAMCLAAAVKRWYLEPQG